MTWRLLEELAPLLKENVDRGLNSRLLYQKQFKSNDSVIPNNYDLMLEPTQNRNSEIGIVEQRL